MVCKSTALASLVFSSATTVDIEITVSWRVVIRDLTDVAFDLIHQQRHEVDPSRQYLNAHTSSTVPIVAQHQ